MMGVKGVAKSQPKMIWTFWRLPNLNRYLLVQQKN